MFTEALFHSDVPERIEEPLAPEMDQDGFSVSSYDHLRYRDTFLQEPSGWYDDSADEAPPSPLFFLMMGVIRVSFSSQRSMSFRELGTGMAILGLGMTLVASAQRLENLFDQPLRPALKATLFTSDEKSDNRAFALLGDRIESSYQLLCSNYEEMKVDRFLSEKDLLCPISRSIIARPVLTSTGRWFDQKDIEAWFSKGRHIDPLSRLPISSIVKSIDKQKEILLALEEIEKRLTVLPRPHPGFSAPGAGRR